MELIKKIKEAEAQGRQIIEQAKADAARQAEKEREQRRQALIQTEQKRKKTTEAAVAAAESEGLAEVKKLKAQAEKRRQQLRNKVESKKAGAVARVMDYLRG